MRKVIAFLIIPAILIVWVLDFIFSRLAKLTRKILNRLYIKGSDLSGYKRGKDE